MSILRDTLPAKKRRTVIQNFQAMKAHQFVKATITIAAMRPFARVQIGSFISGGVSSEYGDLVDFLKIVLPVQEQSEHYNP